MIDFSQVKGIEVKEGQVKSLSIDGQQVWSGEITITCNTGEHFSVTGTGKYSVGDPINVVITADSNYYFSSYNFTPTNVADIEVDNNPSYNQLVLSGTASEDLDLVVAVSYCYAFEYSDGDTRTEGTITTSANNKTKTINNNNYNKTIYYTQSVSVDFTLKSRLTWNDLQGYQANTRALIPGNQLKSIEGDNIFTLNNQIIYCGGSSYYYVLNSDNMWERRDWKFASDITSKYIYGQYIWTDFNGTVYHSNGSYQYYLDGDTWRKKTWSGSTNFYGYYVWKDEIRNVIYLSNYSSQYYLSGNTWTTKTWSADSGVYPNRMYGYSIWRQGNYYIYSSVNSYQYRYDGSKWSKITYSGANPEGRDIWKSGDKFFWSSSSNKYTYQLTDSTWSAITWENIPLEGVSGRKIWSNNNDIYYSSGNREWKIVVPTSSASPSLYAIDFSLLNSVELITNYRGASPTYSTDDYNAYCNVYTSARLQKTFTQRNLSFIMSSQPIYATKVSTNFSFRYVGFGGQEYSLKTNTQTTYYIYSSTAYSSNYNIYSYDLPYTLNYSSLSSSCDSSSPSSYSLSRTLKSGTFKIKATSNVHILFKRTSSPYAGATTGTLIDSWGNIDREITIYYGDSIEWTAYCNPALDSGSNRRPARLLLSQGYGYNVINNSGWVSDGTYSVYISRYQCSHSVSTTSNGYNYTYYYDAEKFNGIDYYYLPSTSEPRVFGLENSSGAELNVESFYYYDTSNVNRYSTNDGNVSPYSAQLTRESYNINRDRTNAIHDVYLRLYYNGTSTYYTINPTRDDDWSSC